MSENKIPKKIHYCWFGGKPLPKEYQKNIESWKKYMPDYEIIRWDEKNYDYNKMNFTKQAYKEKKWAFLTDYARLDIVYNNGGIYFDTDVEVIKSFDELLSNDAFMGVENDGSIATGLGFGAVKGHETIKKNMDYYKSKKVFDGDVLSNNINCPLITTNIFKEYGYIYDNNKCEILNVAIYPVDYFCPMDYKTGIINITNNTYSIHKYSFSWGTKIEKQMFKYNQLMFKHKSLKYLYPVVNFFYFKPFGYFYKIKKYGISNSIKKLLRKIGGKK